jgi:hypothetical protein
MPDLAMCRAYGCPKRTSCYRAIASPDTLQAYAVFTYGPDGCASYIPMKPQRKPRKSKSKLP